MSLCFRKCKLTQREVEDNKKDPGEEETGVGEKETYWLFPFLWLKLKKKREQRFPYLENYLLEVSVLDILKQFVVKGNHLRNFLFSRFFIKNSITDWKIYNLLNKMSIPLKKIL